MKQLCPALAYYEFVLFSSEIKDENIIGDVNDDVLYILEHLPVCMFP
jgi:hypothetical protein